MVESEAIPGKCGIRPSLQKLSQRVPKKGPISVRTGKMVESGPIPGKVGIRPSLEQLSRRVPKKGPISVGIHDLLINCHVCLNLVSRDMFFRA